MRYIGSFSILLFLLITFSEACGCSVVPSRNQQEGVGGSSSLYVTDVGGVVWVINEKNETLFQSSYWKSYRSIAEDVVLVRLDSALGKESIFAIVTPTAVKVVKSQDGRKIRRYSPGVYVGGDGKKVQYLYGKKSVLEPGLAVGYRLVEYDEVVKMWVAISVPGGEYYFVSPNGCLLGDGILSWASRHELAKNGNVVAYESSRKVGLLDLDTGKWVLKPVYYSFLGCGENRTVWRMGSGEPAIVLNDDFEKKYMIPYRHVVEEVLSSGVVVCFDATGKYGRYDIDGSYVVLDEIEKYYYSVDKKWVFARNVSGKLAIYDCNMNLAMEFEEEVEPGWVMGSGLAVVKKAGKLASFPF